MDPLEETVKKKIEPILNPDGPNKEATDELIEALSEVANSESFARDYAKNLIEAIKKGMKFKQERNMNKFMQFRALNKKWTKKLLQKE